MPKNQYVLNQATCMRTGEPAASCGCADHRAKRMAANAAVTQADQISNQRALTFNMREVSFEDQRKLLRMGYVPADVPTTNADAYDDTADYQLNSLSLVPKAPTENVT